MKKTHEAKDTRDSLPIAKLLLVTLIVLTIGGIMMQNYLLKKRVKNLQERIESVEETIENNYLIPMQPT